jgi:hypothetical protein
MILPSACRLWQVDQLGPTPEIAGDPPSQLHHAMGHDPTNKADLFSCGQLRTPPDPDLEAALNQLESAVKQE